MNTEGSVLNHTGDIDGHREHKKHASYTVLYEWILKSRVGTRGLLCGSAAALGENMTTMIWCSQFFSFFIVVLDVTHKAMSSKSETDRDKMRPCNAAQKSSFTSEDLRGASRGFHVGDGVMFS